MNISNILRGGYSPYKYISPLKSEIYKDSKLFEIRKDCISYLTHNKLPDINTIFEYIDFLDNEFGELLKLKDNIPVNFYEGLFVQLGHTLDMLTIESELSGFDSRMLDLNLNSQLNTLMNEMSLYYFILSSIIHQEDPNESNN
jgi:hypothetical protein